MLDANQRKRVKQKLSMSINLGEDIYLIAKSNYRDDIESILKEIADDKKTDFVWKSAENDKLSDIKSMLIKGGILLIRGSKKLHGNMYSFMRECSEREFRQVNLRDTLETVMVSNDFFFVFLVSPEDEESIEHNYISGLQDRLHRVWFPNLL